MSEIFFEAPSALNRLRSGPSRPTMARSRGSGRGASRDGALSFESMSFGAL